MSNREGKHKKVTWRVGQLCKACGKSKVEKAKCHKRCLICKTCGASNF